MNVCKPSSSEAEVTDARKLVLLGILLQALHILFGVTAILGVLLTQSRAHVAAGSVYQSHLRWQFVTFWIGLAGYASGFYLWVTQDNPWLIYLAIAMVGYRLAISVWYWQAAKAIRRRVL